MSTNSRIIGINVEIPYLKDLEKTPNNVNAKGFKIKPSKQEESTADDDELEFFHTSGNVNLLGSTYLKKKFPEP